MADVQFTDEQFARTAHATKLPPLIGLVVRMGLAKDQRGAERVLLIVAVLAILATIGIWAFSGSDVEDVPGPLEQRGAPLR